MIFNLFVFFSIFNSAAAPLEFTRIDPHGKIKQEAEFNEKQKDCLVCHQLDKNKGFKKVVEKISVETCFNCHNKAPHSGVVEHVAHQVTCLSCHSFHRWDETHFQKKSNLFVDLKSNQKFNDYQLKDGSGLMIKKDCQDCHRWK